MNEMILLILKSKISIVVGLKMALHSLYETRPGYIPKVCFSNEQLICRREKLPFLNYQYCQLEIRQDFITSI